MYFSTRSRFAIQILVDLTVYGYENNVKIKDVSKRQGISVKYLEQIVAVLNKAGYVKGERGPQGGYRLGMNPEDITAGMIMRIMDGSQSEDDTEKNAECPWISKCVDQGVFAKLCKSMDDILDKTTIADLVDFAKREGFMESIDGPEYFI